MTDKRAELVELIRKADSKAKASAALDIALAEAAEVCEAKGEEWRKHGNRGAGVGCNTCTDAIRSLMSKP